MTNLLLQYALRELLVLPEEEQGEHAKVILERLDEDAVDIERGGFSLWLGDEDPSGFQCGKLLYNP